jgi:hypothetical protein
MSQDMIVNQVYSSVFRAIAFDPETSEITILFNGGKSYKYAGCDREEFEAMALAKARGESAGKAFGIFKANHPGVPMAECPRYFERFLPDESEEGKAKAERKERVKNVQLVDGEFDGRTGERKKDDEQTDLALDVEEPKTKFQYPD